MSMMESALELRALPRRQIALLLAAGIAASLVVVSPSIRSVPGVSNVGAQARVVQGYGKLPVSFEPNVGQAPDRYDFVAHGQGFGMAINATGATLALGTKKAQDLVRVNILGASRFAKPRTLEPLPGKVNYFIGNDPSKWRSNVSTFERVSYRNVLPGVRVTYHGATAGTLEYDFVVAPSADPTDIRVGFSGVNDVALKGGDLVITTAHGAVTEQRPVLYQNIAGRRIAVDGRFTLTGHEVGFKVGAYDHHHSLVIDPTVVYSTYLGGSGDDIGTAIAVDGTGAAYVTGYTASSTDFPILSPSIQGPFGGGLHDAFVTKLNATGSALVYSTYLGGSGDEWGSGIAVDDTGAAYVTGKTNSTNFPTQAPFQGSNGGGMDAFVTKLNAEGSALIYSTYLGGSGPDWGFSIAANAVGAAYVAGFTQSTNFPTQAPFQGSIAGGADAFVTKLNGAGSALIYSTYLGGSNHDIGRGIAFDESGSVYVTGETFSTNFPTEAPFQGSKAGGDRDVFVAKLNDTGSVLVYSSYLGGSGDDIGYGIAVNGSSAYVTGQTSSTNFPTHAPFQTSLAGGQDDAFVTKINDTGSALTYSTYLGGSGEDGGYGIAVDGTGAAYVTGVTESANFPTESPFQEANAGRDAFVTKLNTAGSALDYSTYLGGSGGTNGDFGLGIAVDGSSAYVTGQTSSTSFPATEAPFQESNAGGADDAFVAKIGFAFTLTATTLGTGAGTITSAPDGIDCGITCSASFVTGTSVTLTATPDATAHFTGWSGDCTNATGTCTVSMDQAHAVTATFTRRSSGGGGASTNPPTVTDAGSGGGMVTSSPSGIDCGSDCSENYDPGTTVTLTATPDAGSSFSGWGQDCSGSSGTNCTLTMSAAQAATATFDIQPSPSPTPSPSPSPAPSDLPSPTPSVLPSPTLSVLPSTEPTPSPSPVATCRGHEVTIQVAAANLTTLGTAGDDVINGTSGIDTINGRGGNDIICGLGGNDTLRGNAGDDTLYGNANADTLHGNAGDDALYGNAGNDTIHGNDGDDTLRGVAGKDKLYGDRGNDILYGNNGNDILQGNDGDDTLSGGANSDACNGGAGLDTGAFCEPFIQ